MASETYGVGEDRVELHWMDVKGLAKILRRLPQNAVIQVNRVGNLSVFLVVDNDQTQWTWLGTIDIRQEIFIPSEEYEKTYGKKTYY